MVKSDNIDLLHSYKGKQAKVILQCYQRFSRDLSFDFFKDSLNFCVLRVSKCQF